MNSSLPVKVKKLLDTAPRRVSRKFHLWCECIAAVDAAPRGGKHAAARRFSRRLGVRIKTIFTRRSLCRKKGASVLLDRRFIPSAWAGQHRQSLPLATIRHLQALGLNAVLSDRQVCSRLLDQLHRWRNGDRSARIPGYTAPPAGDPPAGWSERNLCRHLKGRVRIAPKTILCQAIARLHADGTISYSLKGGGAK